MFADFRVCVDRLCLFFACGLASSFVVYRCSRCISLFFHAWLVICVSGLPLFPSRVSLFSRVVCGFRLLSSTQTVAAATQETVLGAGGIGRPETQITNHAWKNK